MADARDANTGPGAGRPASGAAPDVSSAMAAIAAAARAAGVGPTGGDPAHVLGTLVLLRELRERLATWEPALIEAARRDGASWADLAAALGMASRQAAERRYLRLRPGSGAATAEQRVKDERDRRAADRAVITWARDHAADLRSLAGRVDALAADATGHAARADFAALREALGRDDAALLLRPLADTRRHLAQDHPALAADLDRVAEQEQRLRHDSNQARRG